MVALPRWGRAREPRAFGPSDGTAGTASLAAMPEARKLAEDRLREIEAMSFEEVLRFVDEPVSTDLVGPSGRVYRCKTHAFWDMEPEDSELFVETTVKGRGVAFLQRYQGTDVRMPDGQDEQAPEGEDEVGPHVMPTYQIALAKMGCLATVVATLVALVGGFAYAMSRLLRWL